MPNKPENQSLSDELHREADELGIPPIGADLEQDSPQCFRCKRPTDYQALYCYDCEIALYGE